MGSVQTRTEINKPEHKQTQHWNFLRKPDLNLTRIRPESKKNITLTGIANLLGLMQLEPIHDSMPDCVVTGKTLSLALDSYSVTRYLFFSLGKILGDCEWLC